MKSMVTRARKQHAIRHVRGPVMEKGGSRRPDTASGLVYLCAPPAAADGDATCPAPAAEAPCTLAAAVAPGLLPPYGALSPTGSATSVREAGCGKTCPLALGCAAVMLECGAANTA